MDADLQPRAAPGGHPAPEHGGARSPYEGGPSAGTRARPPALRVALLTNFVPPYRLSLFEALAARVGRLLVLTSTPMEPGRPWRVETGTLDVTVQRTLTIRQTQRGEGFSDPVFVHFPLDTAERLRAFAPDVVVSGELGARTLAALRFCRRHRTPLVAWATLSEQTERRRDPLRRLLRRRLLAAVDHVLVNGASGERYVRSYGVPAERITRVPYTTDMAPFLALPLHPPGDTPLRVLAVGNLIQRKAPEVLLAGARAAASPLHPIELTFVGDGPLRGSLERAAASPLPGLTVRFAGGVDYLVLPRFYAAADLLAFPTRADEWGLVVNEALAAGVPVLGSRASQAVEELVQDGHNGWLLEGDGPDAVARGLARACSVGPERRAAMRKEARRSAARLEPRMAAERIHRVLGALLPGGAR